MENFMVYPFYLYEPHCGNQYALLHDRQYGYRNVPFTNTQTDIQTDTKRQTDSPTEEELSRWKETDGETERKENWDEKQEHM